MVAVPPELAEAYRACERMARTHYENFPVASLLLPSHMRPHVAALYAFARTADDFADEGDRPPEVREALLDEWGRQLDARLGTSALSAGTARSTASSERSESVLRPLSFVLDATVHSIRACALPVQLFHDLLSAFRQDVRVKRYATWDEVLDYCRRSANPVGRLVLRIGGYDSPRLDRESDAVCTALQLTNFWQDLERDWMNGRLYVPAADLRATGAREEDLGAPPWTAEWRAALERVAARTRTLFDEGRAIADRVHGRLKWELRLTWLGGVHILETLERRGFDVFERRPALSKADAPRLAWRALTWRSHRVMDGTE
jgi:hydroxysqualene synthase